MKKKISMDRYRFVLQDVEDEIIKARSKFPPFNSAHEGYGILLEELDELWEEIKKKDTVRDKKLMYEEAKQVAAMAVSFMVDVCGEDA